MDNAIETLKRQADVTSKSLFMLILSVPVGQHESGTIYDDFRTV
jgi:hypothetical protein